MSTATTRPSGPGAAIDHGLVPSTFCRPPHGAMAGLALVVRTATTPSRAARRVDHIAVPKWVGLRRATAPIPCCRARSTASTRARSVSTWPTPSRPSSSSRGPVSTSAPGSVTAAIAPLRSRAAYQGRRSMPCEPCPQRSAWTRLSATSAASADGTPSASSTREPKLRRSSGACRRSLIAASSPSSGYLYTVLHTTTGRRKEPRMFSLVVQMEVRPGRREEFLAAIGANAEASVRDEPGCLRFDVSAVAEDENRFFLYELYTDAAAFDTHKASPHFAQWRTVAEQVLAAQVNTPGSLVVTHTAEESA